MTKPSAHLHLIVSANIKNPPGQNDITKVIHIMADLVEHVRMKILHPPVTTYCIDEGNEGITSVVLLTTSHSSIHIWNALEPEYSKLEFDLYSCAPFTVNEVIDFLKSKFDLSNIKYKFLDRDNDLKELKESKRFSIFNHVETD